MHVYGSSNSTELGARLVLASPEGNIIEYALQLEFPPINNEAEYETLEIRLKMAKEQGYDA